MAPINEEVGRASRLGLLLLFAALASHCEALKKASPPPKAAVPKAAALASQKTSVSAGQRGPPYLSPPIDIATGPSSHKAFFGKDYPKDEQPAVGGKAAAKELAKKGKPYPKMQVNKAFDSDYVQDENGDGGKWQAQMDYDYARLGYNKAVDRAKKEQGEYADAADKARRESGEYDDAASRAKDSSGKVSDAEAARDAEARRQKEASNGTGTDHRGEDSKKNLDGMEAKIAAAERAYEKEKQDYKECEKELEDAKARLEALKQEKAALEAQGLQETKMLAMERATLEKEIASRTGAEAKVNAAQKLKDQADKELAKEKAEADEANNKLAVETKEFNKVKQDLENAKLRLAKLQGVSVDKLAGASLKSGAATSSAFAAVLLVVSTVAARSLV